MRGVVTPLRQFVCVLLSVVTVSGILAVVMDGRAGAGAVVTRASASNADPKIVPRLIPTVGGRMRSLPVLAHHMTASTTLGPSQPRSHPLAGVGGLVPDAPINGPLNLSGNWSGLFEGGSGATFTGVQGDWTVPAVSSSSSDEASATWVGIDGVETTSLIQTGTAQNSGPDYGGTQYYAWVELLPGAPIVITSGSDPAPVLPGDAMSAAIEEDSTDVWTVSIDDITQDWSSSQEYSYTTPGLTAEWIEEAPLVDGSLSPLADYGSTTFSDLAILGTGFSSLGAYPLYMATSMGAIISYPTDFDSSADSFALFYGSPAPEVTSVSPDESSTSGGTTVTIGGNFVTGVTAVDIGGVSAQFSEDIAAGTVTAAAPPHAAGTVDITVTTPGGTSSTSGLDHFTYIAPSQSPPPPPPPAQHGYWLVGSDGGIFTFGSAQFYGSTGSLVLQRPVVGIVPTADHDGYWLDASDGGVFSYGDTQFYGSIPGLGIHPYGSGAPDSLDAPIVGMVPSADGGGYFMVGADGGVFAFGDAKFAGSCPGIGGCSGAAVAVMPDASGNGYWVVTATGAVYAFGDAPFYGEPGPQSVPVTSAVRSPSGKGYMILYANGAIASFGSTPYMGCPAPGFYGGLNPATAIFTTADGGGYWVATANGTVVNCGEPPDGAPDLGSMAGTHLNGSIIAGTGW